ncbi:MAG: putative zinc-binding peptidase [Acetobacteraceae bacterium]|nr:putative zinc-binding peptidase [Acetobacteraceae bacterium]
MRLFACDNCDNLLHFENVKCESCAAPLGFLPDLGSLSALREEEGALRAAADPANRPWKRCANAAYDACNWLLPAGSDTEYCSACCHNRTVPDLTLAANLPLWRRMQFAKHRLVYSLDRMGLPHPCRAKGSDTGLAFDVLADPDDPAAPRVMTGHDEGLITLALAEADDAERERRRTEMGEPYRTLLGHFRHEVGHHYWNLLVRDAGRLEECRAVFGDERGDYGEALKAHYARGASDDWRGRFISAYAAAHPWEDWAESWAHYMHIQDSVEMAESLGLHIRPRLDATGDLSARIRLDPYAERDYGRVMAAWAPLTVAVNSLNRCMGTPDAYPFVMSEAVVAKLRYIHGLVQAEGNATTAAAA